MKIKIMVLVAFLTMASAVCAAELKLFEVELRNASRSEITAAIAGAGARKTSGGKDLETWNASKINLPGAQELEVVYLDDKLVLVQYKFTRSDSKADERLRKMIISKYGLPQDGDSKFGDQFGPDGKFHWKFEGGMELIYTKEFFGTVYLTYVNKSEQSKLEARVKSADLARTQHEAKKSASAF
jgi:hypothetical protein